MLIIAVVDVHKHDTVTWYFELESVDKIHPRFDIGQVLIPGICAKQNVRLLYLIIA